MLSSVYQQPSLSTTDQHLSLRHILTSPNQVAVAVYGYEVAGALTGDIHYTSDMSSSASDDISHTSEMLLSSAAASTVAPKKV